MLSFSAFKQVYAAVVAQLITFCTAEMQDSIAIHNIGWQSDKYDFGLYLRRSAYRFYLAYQQLTANPNVRSICDVGGFWGAFPITLQRLGYSAAMTETIGLYGNAFDPLFEFISSEGVAIYDYDPFAPDAALGPTFDAAVAMAIIEHYPHSLRAFMANLSRAVASTGFVYLEVPNMSYWPKRVSLLFGHSPLPSIADVFHSATPFVGHHREMTIHDLRLLMKLSNWKILSQQYYNYSCQGSLLFRLRSSPMCTLAYYLLPSSRECISVLCQPTPVSHS